MISTQVQPDLREERIIPFPIDIEPTPQPPHIEELSTRLFTEPKVLTGVGACLFEKSTGDHILIDESIVPVLAQPVSRRYRGFSFFTVDFPPAGGEVEPTRAWLMVSPDLRRLMLTTHDLLGCTEYTLQRIEQDTRNSVVLIVDNDAKGATVCQNWSRLLELGAYEEEPSKAGTFTRRKWLAMLFASLASGACAPAALTLTPTAETPKGHIPTGLPGASETATPSAGPGVESTHQPTSTALATAVPTPYPDLDIGGSIVPVRDLLNASPDYQMEVSNALSEKDRAHLVECLASIIYVDRWENLDVGNAYRWLLMLLFEPIDESIDLRTFDIRDPSLCIQLKPKPEWADVRLDISAHFNGADDHFFGVFASNMHTKLNYLDWPLIYFDIPRSLYSKVDLRLEPDVAFFMPDAARAYVSEAEQSSIINSTLLMNEFMGRYRNVRIEITFSSDICNAEQGEGRIVFHLPCFEQDDELLLSHVATHEAAHKYFELVAGSALDFLPKDFFFRYDNLYLRLDFKNNAILRNLLREGFYAGRGMGHPWDNSDEFFASSSSLFLTGEPEYRYGMQNKFVNAVEELHRFGDISNEEYDAIIELVRMTLEIYMRNPAFVNHQDLFGSRLLAFAGL